ncbi:MAG TPA: type II toxin-antitoxin system VapC family toxin [Bryobacteraceae bacterium]|jgi:predicted nucleic acid-binding protein|nr:type II toxin-antitoxin system VapC family toxin [Bryobacteraceae bacterium]
MPASKVIDSWAMVAWIQDEPGGNELEAFLLKADAGKLQLFMSWYNVAETFYTVAKRKEFAVAEEFLARLPSLPIRLVLPDEEGIMAAARVKAAHSVALGDAFAIALAQSEGASVITGDHEIRRCKLVPVEWVGA